MNKPKFPFFELMIGGSLFFCGLIGIKKSNSSPKAFIFSKLGGFGKFLSKMPIIGIGGMFSKILFTVGSLLLLIAVVKIIMVVAASLKMRKQQRIQERIVQKQEQIIQEPVVRQQMSQQVQLQKSDKF